VATLQPATSVAVRRLDSGAGVGEALGVANTFGVSSAQPLVGREAELAMAGAAVRGLGEGRASVLAIEGEPGIGKTRLVQTVVDDAPSRDVAVFWGQAHPF
jgi:hypothetical protein